MAIDILPERWDPFGGLLDGYSTTSLDSMPSSEECEKAILGAILTWPEVIDDVRGRLRPEHFHQERHARLYRTMLWLVDQDPPQPIDIRTVQARLERLDDFDSTHIWYLATLVDFLPSLNALDIYVQIVIELAAKRELVKVAATLAYEGRNGVRPREAIANALRQLEAVENASSGSDWLRMDDIQDATMAKLETGGCGELYIPTGVPAVDAICGGYAIGKLTYVAGRPGHGKSAWAQQTAENTAMAKSPSDRQPVGFVSIEMTAQELFLRSLCRRTGMPYQRLVKGGFTGDEWAVVNRAASEIHGSKMYIEPSSMGVSSVIAACSKLRRKYGAAIFVIDYLGLLDTKDLRTRENRNLEVAEMSRRLCSFAKDENVAVVALSQLKRPESMSSNKRPGLEALRDSGALEQDAFMVQFVWREVDAKNHFTSNAEVIIAKHRNGETGCVEMDFIGPRMLFRPRSKRVEVLPKD
jgi:replicative DNA helicase